MCKTIIGAGISMFIIIIIIKAIRRTGPGVPVKEEVERPGLPPLRPPNHKQKHTLHPQQPHPMKRNLSEMMGSLMQEGLGCGNNKNASRQCGPSVKGTRSLHVH
jgi:hypothetical protein